VAPRAARDSAHHRRPTLAAAFSATSDQLQSDCAALSKQRLHVLGQTLGVGLQQIAQDGGVAGACNDQQPFAGRRFG